MQIGRSKAMFIGSKDIETIEQARAYLKSRARDAVECYKMAPRGTFTSTVQLAKYLAMYW